MMLVIVLWYFIHRFDLLEKVSFVIISSFSFTISSTFLCL